jgi:hypothetical protein
MCQNTLVETRKKLNIFNLYKNHAFIILFKHTSCTVFFSSIYSFMPHGETYS